nr:hypothetical protein [Tanacetum cinerariifolium]
MSRDVLTVGSTMRIPLLYQGEYSQWSERFINYLEEQTDGEEMINCIKHGYQPLPRVTQVSIARTSSTEQPSLKDKSMWSDQEKKIQKINRDVNDAMGLKKKTVVVTSDPLASIDETTKVSKRKEKVVVSSDSKGSDADDFSELKKISALLAKAFNRRKFYSKPTNNNLRTSSTSQSANKKQEYVKSDDKKVKKKDDKKKRDMAKSNVIIMLLTKKDKDEQVLLAEDHAWMESSSDSDQEINANMVFIAQIKKVFSDSEASSSSADDKIFEVSYYLSESESESKYETSKYYDNNTTYGLFVNDNDDQEIFHDCENFLENLIEAQINHNESAVDHNDSEGYDKLIKKFNKKIVKCLKQNLKTIESLKSKDVEKGIESSDKVVSETENNSENDCQVIEKVCDSEENPNMIAPGMFKLSVSQSVLPISVTKTSCASNGVENVEKGIESSEKVVSETENNSENDCQVIEKVCDSEENPNMIALGMFKLSVSQSVLLISVTKTSCASNGVERCSKHITGNHALLKNFVEKLLRTVRFGNNDFEVIVGYGDVVIGSMKINKVYYVEGLPKMKFEKDHLCFACEQGKIHRKHHKSKTDFASNKPLYLLHMDLCGPMHVESINRKRYVLVVVDDYSRYTWRVRTDNGTEFKNKTLAKFFDEVSNTQQFSAARTPQQNGVMERKNRTLVEAARTMLTFANLPLFFLG